MAREALRWSLAPVGDVVSAARFLRQLPGFLRHPLTVDEARATFRRRLERREADFLQLVRDGIYAVEDNPYRQLLRLAGCEYGDLERLVGQDGLEGTAGRLFRHGVYLTVDELKGRRPAVRGNGVVHVDPRRLRAPWLAGHFEAATSGSRGMRTPVPIELAFIRERAVNAILAWSPRGAGRPRRPTGPSPSGPPRDRAARSRRGGRCLPDRDRGRDGGRADHEPGVARWAGPARGTAKAPGDGLGQNPAPTRDLDWPAPGSPVTGCRVLRKH